MIQLAKNDPENFSVVYQLALKYESMGKTDLAEETAQSIVDANIDSAGMAAFKVLLYSSLESQDPSPLIVYADKNPGNENAKTALKNAMSLVRRAKDNPQLEADLFVRYIGLYDNPDPGMLNGFAWRMSELALNLDLALDKVTIAVDQESDDERKHMYIDTKAEVLWKLGKTDEALVEIEKCIQFNPEDSYYQKQKDKFVGEEK